jgi:hypothetical protein
MMQHEIKASQQPAGQRPTYKHKAHHRTWQHDEKQHRQLNKETPATQLMGDAHE